MWAATTSYCFSRATTGGGVQPRCCGAVRRVRLSAGGIEAEGRHGVLRFIPFTRFSIGAVGPRGPVPDGGANFQRRAVGEARRQASACRGSRTPGRVDVFRLSDDVPQCRLDGARWSRSTFCRAPTPPTSAIAGCRVSDLLLPAAHDRPPWLDKASHRRALRDLSSLRPLHWQRQRRCLR